MYQMLSSALQWQLLLAVELNRVYWVRLGVAGWTARPLESCPQVCRTLHLEHIKVPKQGLKQDKPQSVLAR